MFRHVCVSAQKQETVVILTLKSSRLLALATILDSASDTRCTRTHALLTHAHMLVVKLCSTLAFLSAVVGSTDLYHRVVNAKHRGELLCRCLWRAQMCGLWPEFPINVDVAQTPKPSMASERSWSVDAMLPWMGWRRWMPRWTWLRAGHCAGAVKSSGRRPRTATSIGPGLPTSHYSAHADVWDP